LIKFCKKCEQFKSFAMAIMAFTLLCVLWEVLLKILSISEFVFPGPLVVFNSAWELISTGVLFKHTVASLYRVTAGFYLAVITGIPLGIVLGRVKAARQLLIPIIQFLRPISPLAWIPLAMLWFGIGDPPAIYLIFLACFFPLVISTVIAVDSINEVFFQVAANFNFTRMDYLMKVIFPAIVPDVVTALRLTVSIAWLVVVAAEMIAVQSGLGYLILDSRNALRMDYVLVGMGVIGIIGLLLDFIVSQLAKGESSVWMKCG